MRAFLSLVAGIATAAGALAADPVTIELQSQSRVRLKVVTVGNLAELRGGDPALREQIARLDVADLKPQEQSVTVTRRAVEYRLRLAGIDTSRFALTGAERTTITQDKRTVTPEEVVEAARNELYHWLTVPRETVRVELARPIVVHLPEVPAGEIISITAAPHVKPVGLGRAQMHVVISTPEETLLALGVDLEVKSLNRSTEAIKQVVTPASPSPAAPRSGVTVRTDESPAATQQTAATVAAAGPTAPSPVLIKPRQRVTMYVRSGGLNVSAVGEAQQEGRLGQTILVQNIDSKKSVSARVSGPATVEIDLDGTQK